jgi:hypothetical protein
MYKRLSFIYVAILIITYGCSKTTDQKSTIDNTTIPVTTVTTPTVLLLSKVKSDNGIKKDSILYTYDGLNRMSQIYYVGDKLHEQYTYDAQSQVLTKTTFTDSGSPLGTISHNAGFAYNTPYKDISGVDVRGVFMTYNYSAPAKPALLVWNEMVDLKVRRQDLADTSAYIFNYYGNGDVSSISYDHTPAFTGGAESIVYSYAYTYDSGKKQPFANVKGNLYTFVIPTSNNNALTEILSVSKSTQPLSYEQTYYYNTYTYNSSGFPVKKVTSKVSGNITTTTTYLYTYITVPAI